MRLATPYPEVAPEAYQALLKATTQAAALARTQGMDPKLLELVKLRASQLNGCAFCLDMHHARAEALGESSRRRALVAAWREADLFTDAERAALAWTEDLTLVRDDDESYAEVCRLFPEPQRVSLGLAIGIITAWNRLGRAFRPALEER